MTWPLLIAISGAGGPRVGDNPRFRQWAAELGADRILPGRAFCRLGLPRNACHQALGFRREHPEGRIILLGYSVGGDEAVGLANRLGRQGVRIDAMITFDPHRKYCFGYRNYALTAGNVATALNFYQRNGLALLSGRNPFRGSPIQGAINHDLTGAPTDHVSIVTDALRWHASAIAAALRA